MKVCKGTACHAACADASVGWMEDALGLRVGETSEDGAVSLEAVYCLGFCNAGPTVEVEGRIYGELTPERAKALAKDLASGGGLAEAHDALVPRFEVHGGPAIVLERLAQPIDATNLDVARAHGAFAGLAKALASTRRRSRSSPRSTPRSSAVAAAPASRRREVALRRRNAQTTGEAYVVCNADEGDPGSYIDKYLMERDPFARPRRLALARLAIGAQRGFVYIRTSIRSRRPR